MTTLPLTSFFIFHFMKFFYLLDWASLRLVESASFSLMSHLFPYYVFVYLLLFSQSLMYAMIIFLFIPCLGCFRDPNIVAFWD